MSISISSSYRILNVKQQVEKIIECLRDSPSTFQVHELCESLKHLMFEDDSQKLVSISKTLLTLDPYFETLKQIHSRLKDVSIQRCLADIISLLATVHEAAIKDGFKDTIKYRLIGNKMPIKYWGDEYIAQLVVDIVNEFRENQFSRQVQNQLAGLVEEIADYYFKHDSIIEAIDLLIEIKQINLIERHLIRIEGTETRGILYKSALYLQECASCMNESEALLCKAFDLFLLGEHYINALILALKFEKTCQVYKVFDKCKDTGMVKQMCLILARQSKYIDHDVIQEDMIPLLSNCRLSHYFLHFAKELNIMKCKAPFTRFESFEFINETLKLESYIPLSYFVSSALINCGFGTDLLLKHLVCVNNLRHYTFNEISYLLSLFGFLNRWNVEKTMEFLEHFNAHDLVKFKPGALLACGVSLCGIKDEKNYFSLFDCWIALENESFELQLCMVIGMGVCYSGTNRRDVLDKLLSIVTHSKTPIIIKGIASLSCGLVSISSNYESLQDQLFQELIKLDKVIQNVDQLVTSWFLLLGIGFCFFGTASTTNLMLNNIRLLTNTNLKYIAYVTFISCQYAFSGNVLKIQQLLNIISQDYKCIEELLEPNGRSEHKHKACTTQSGSRKVELIASIDQSTKKLKLKSKKGSPSKYTEMSVFEQVLESLKNENKQTEAAKLNCFNQKPNKLASKLNYENDIVCSKSVSSSSIINDDSFLSCESLDLTSLTSKDGRRYNDSREVSTENQKSEDCKTFLIHALKSLNENLSSALNNPQGFVNTKVNVNSLSRAAIKSLPKEIAVLGISLIAFGEEVGSKMTQRIFFDLIQKGDSFIKKLIPLAFALLSHSDPKIEIIKTLYNLKHHCVSGLDTNLIISLGLIGAGTNNSYIKKIIGDFDSNKCKNAEIMSSVNLANGLLDLGKGSLCLNSLQYNKQLISKTAIGSLLIIAFTCLDANSILFDKLPHLINYLAPAIQPKMLLTLDEDTLEPMSLCCKVGKAIDIFDQVDKINHISSNQFINTPIILNCEEKIEIIDKNYTPLLPFAEHILLVRKAENQNLDRK